MVASRILFFDFSYILVAASMTDRQRLHARPGVNGAVENIAFVAPLPAHSTSEIAGVRHRERNEPWEVHRWPAEITVV